MDHDYKAAKQWLDENVIRNKDNVRIDLILDHALEIARKLQEGFVMVPVETDQSMRIAYLNKVDCRNLPADQRLANINECYKAMITAAQETRKG